MAIVEIKDIIDSDEGLVTIKVDVIDPSPGIPTGKLSIEYDRTSFVIWHDLWVSRRKPSYVSCSIMVNDYQLGITDNSFLAGIR